MANPINRKRITACILALGLTFSTLLLSGCFNASEDDSEIPWTRPHSWEDNAPGMGGGGRGSTF